MKLTTKRDRWYFWRELFSYMIPMILIVWTVDVFFNFMQCPLHPEWSAPCSVIWVNAAGYGFFLIITIIFAIFSARKLRKIKKKIENEFLEVINNTKNESKDQTEKIEKTEEKMGDDKKVKVTKPKKVIVKAEKKEPTKKMVKKNVKKKSNKVNEVSTKRKSPTSKKSTKKII